MNVKNRMRNGFAATVTAVVMIGCWIRPADAGSWEREFLYRAKAKSLAYYIIGVMHDLQGRPKDAVEAFKASLHWGDSYAAHLRLGADYARMGELDKAEVELKRALERDPKNVQARYLLALIYSTQKRFEDSAREYEKILQSFVEVDPENYEIYGYLGQLYYSQKNYSKAVKQFEMMLKVRPEDPDLLFLVGALYLEMGDRDKAKAYFRKAIGYDPEHAPALNSLGYMMAEEGVELDTAEDYVRKALEQEPNNPAYLDSMGWVYYKKGEYEKALEFLLEAAERIKDPVIYEHLGDVYYALDNSAEARKYWQASLELDPGRTSLKEKIHSLSAK